MPAGDLASRGKFYIPCL